MRAPGTNRIGGQDMHDDQASDRTPTGAGHDAATGLTTGSTLFIAADGDEAKRRAIDRLIAAHDALAALPGVRFATGEDIVIWLHPGFELLDVVGPLHFLSATGAAVHLVTTGAAGVPVVSGGGTAVVPTMTVAELPPAPAVILVPGGDTGILLRDAPAMAALASVGANARWVTSVCTGSIALGAAGLLRGRRATSHWSMRHLLPGYGAIKVDERVVEDGNRLTAAGVTAGMDLAIRLVAHLCSENHARCVVLRAEYAPQPPFDTGTPVTAGPALTGLSRGFLAPMEVELQAPTSR